MLSLSKDAVTLDAGPLIAFFNSKDINHSVCKSGFEQLLQAKTNLVTPVPIVFEVHKWFLQKTNPAKAKTVLSAMRGVLIIVPLTQQDIDEVYAMVGNLSNWAGSLEDATVILLAQRYRRPVWTLNYRDFGTFKSLEFWSPI